MSLGSRLSVLLRSVARSPAARRSARRLGRRAMRAMGTDGGHRVSAEEQRPTGARAPDPAPPRERDGAGDGRSRERAGAVDGQSRERAVVGDGRTAPALGGRRGSSPVDITYAARRDDGPGPGEVVWAWVPYEEDLGRGKDRPVLVLAEEAASRGGADGSGRVLVALMMTTRDRAENGEVHTDQHGSTWVDIGTGAWDRQRRDSEVRVDRLLRLPPTAVRREGARLSPARFERVADVVRTVHGWDR